MADDDGDDEKIGQQQQQLEQRPDKNGDPLLVGTSRQRQTQRQRVGGGQRDRCLTQSI